MTVQRFLLLVLFVLFAEVMFSYEYLDEDTYMSFADQTTFVNKYGATTVPVEPFVKITKDQGLYVVKIYPKVEIDNRTLQRVLVNKIDVLEETSNEIGYTNLTFVISDLEELNVIGNTMTIYFEYLEWSQSFDLSTKEFKKFK